MLIKSGPNGLQYNFLITMNHFTEMISKGFILDKILHFLGAFSIILFESFFIIFKLL